MLDLWRTFRLVRFIRQKEKIDPEYRLRDFIVQRFADTKRRFIFWRFNTDQVSRMVEIAKEDKYIDDEQKPMMGVYLKIMPKGRKLISFPVGTLEVIGRELGTGISLTVSAILIFWAQSHYIRHVIGHIIKKHL